MVEEKQEMAVEKASELPAIAQVLPDVDGIKDMFARYKEFQWQLREILGPQDFVYVVKRDGVKPETFLSREAAERVAAVYRKSGQDCVVAEEILKSGLYRLRMMFGIYLLPEGERKVVNELLPAKNDKGEDIQVLRRTEECDAYRRTTVFKDSKGTNAYSCEVQLFGQIGRHHIYGDGCCNRAEKGKDDATSHTITSTAWTRAMKRLIEDATGVPMAMDAGEIGSESASSAMSEVKATAKAPEGVTVTDVIIEPPTEAAPRRGPGRPRKVEPPPTPVTEMSERQKLIAKMRESISAIGKKKKIASTPEQVEQALCYSATKDSGRNFDDLSEEQLAAIWQAEIEPRIATGIKEE
jgi:hypothetical protein